MPTLTLQPDGTAGLDTFASSGDATTNFGSIVAFAIGNVAHTYRTYIKFDLSSLPTNAIISATTLSIYALVDNCSNARTIRVFRLKRAWVEAQLTWNIYSTGNNWSTAGGFHADDCEQTDIGSLALTATETLNVFKDIPLTPTTKAGLDLGNGWLIKADTESSDEYDYASSDAVDSSTRPKLVIVYTQPQPAIARAPGWGRY